MQYCYVLPSFLLCLEMIFFLVFYISPMTTPVRSEMMQVEGANKRKAKIDLGLK